LELSTGSLSGKVPVKLAPHTETVAFGSAKLPPVGFEGNEFRASKPVNVSIFLKTSDDLFKDYNY
jgi:hypothetical protein